jgi:hypothetical protein
VTDDFQSYENEVQLVHTAMRLARRVSRALGAQRGRPSSEAERQAILREAFDHAASAELPGPIPTAPTTTDLVLRAGWRQNEAGRLEIGWCTVPAVPDAEASLDKHLDLRMGRRVQPRLIRSRSRADDSSATRG